MLTEESIEQRQCDRHGEYTSRLFGKTRWTGCRHCADERRATQEIEARAMITKEQEYRRFKSSGLVGRFEATTFDSYSAESEQQRVVRSACEAFAAGIDGTAWSSLWLVGPPGTGKTHLGSAMVHATITAGRWAHIASARDIVRRLRATWSKKSTETEEDVLDELTTCALLVVDEIGASFGTEAETVQLFDVIDKRYQLCRPVVLLSNLSVPAIKAALGDRMHDRLREAARVYACDWPSFRGKL
ncbi:MAG: ATP-binding protein [Pseudomonadota bacterium]